jgi:hypothetical protein
MLEVLILPPFDGQTVMQDERSFRVGEISFFFATN